MLVIDTEGFDGINESINHDSRIFLFSLLISSYFIYNSIGSIDENALNSFSLIINLAREIQMKNNEKEDLNFPSFLWIIRDFALKLQDSFGNSISSKEYLEKALEIKKGVSESVENRNRIRKLIKMFFQERDCFTMVRPCEEEKALQNLQLYNNQFVREEFIKEIKCVRKKIFKEIKPKYFNGKICNGKTLSIICKHFVKVINNGNIPVIDNIWGYLVKNENHKVLKCNFFFIFLLLYIWFYSFFLVITKFLERKIMEIDDKKTILNFKSFKNEVNIIFHF